MKIIISILAFIILSGCTSLKHSLFDMGVGIERSRSDLEQKSIIIDNFEWAYLESTEQTNKPVVVLLHGFGADKDNWTRMAGFLSNFHIIAPDLPGHGDTPFIEGEQYGFDKQSLRLAKFLNELGLKRFHLVGNSMGGGIAVLYAHRHPEQVATLSLVDAVGFYGDQPSKLEQIIEANGPNPLIVRSKADMERLMGFTMEQVPDLPWPATEVLADRAMAREQANDKIFKQLNQEIDVTHNAGGFRYAFEKLTMPTYVLWGEEDRVLDVSSVDKFLQYTPNVQVDILPKVGHAPMLEVPEKTADLLKDFWRLSNVTSLNAEHRLTDNNEL
ncbi:alpha/beta fold hydrolase [Oceaniserpentilla sp. 4NH20-0058]|uniref:alpha/beta fold hydrolase n=1 Tax=Oceaniserpentilla sp. 4NH20-0058 TaxID=3127660 RepID=UPI003104BDBE